MRSITTILGIAVVLAATSCSTSPGPATLARPNDLVLRVTATITPVSETILGGATRLPSGTIVITDASQLAVVFYAPDGNELRRVGRRGSASGEYQGLSWTAQCEPNALYVSDPVQGRITVLDTAGATIRHFAFPRASKMDCRNGTIAALLMPERLRRPDPNQPRERYRANLQLRDYRGEIRGEIENVAVGEFGPLAKVSGIALTSDRLWYGSADSATFEIFTAQGEPLGTVNLDIAPRAATQQYFDDDIEDQATRFKDESSQQSVRLMLGAFSVPRTLPAFKQLVADSRGNIWISGSFAGDTVTNLRVVSSKGAKIREVTIPERVHIYEIGADYILVREETGRPGNVTVYLFDPSQL